MSEMDSSDLDSRGPRWELFLEAEGCGQRFPSLALPQAGTLPRQALRRRPPPRQCVRVDVVTGCRRRAQQESRCSIHSQFGAWATGKLQTIWMKMVGKLQCLGLSHRPLHFYFLTFFFVPFSSPHHRKLLQKRSNNRPGWLDFFSPPVYDVFCKQTCKWIQNLTTLGWSG